jgi:hypothetical protein
MYSLNSFFNLTPTKTPITLESPIPLHVERGGRVSEYRRLSWGEVENI